MQTWVYLNNNFVAQLSINSLLSKGKQVTSITGVSAIAERTTLLAKASACIIVSGSAENRQEATLNIHRKIPALDGIKSIFISSVA